MRKDLELAVKNFTEASERLREGIAQVKDELDKDGVIQRFEFTFELLWKALKIYLEDQGLNCNSPKDCLQQAFRYGILKEEEAFLNMLNDRNKMSHIYSRKESEKIFKNIKDRYSALFQEMCGELAKL